jgi:hypothetical protein
MASLGEGVEPTVEAVLFPDERHDACGNGDSDSSDSDGTLSKWRLKARAASASPQG